MQEEGSSDFVSEFPEPPAYYRLFHGAAALSPPDIVSLQQNLEGDLSTLAPYNGFYSSKPVHRDYDSSKSYKSILKRYRTLLWLILGAYITCDNLVLLSEATDIFRLLLDLASPRNQTAHDIQIRKIELKVENFASTLNDCRIHLAREALVEDMQRQVQSLRTLKTEIERRHEDMLQQLEVLNVDPEPENSLPMDMDMEG